MSAKPAAHPPAEVAPARPLHPQCEGLRCLTADAASLGLSSSAAAADAFRAYHRRMHTHLAPLLEDEFRGHRYPTQIVPFSFEEATALIEAAKSYHVVTTNPEKRRPGAASASRSAPLPPALSSLAARFAAALSSHLFDSCGATISFNGVSLRDALEAGRFRRAALEALLRVHIESMEAEGQRTEQSIAAEIDNCIGRAMQLHSAGEVMEGLASSRDILAEVELAVSFGKELFVGNFVLTEFQPQIILHPSCHFRCVVSHGRLVTCSQRSAYLCYPQLVDTSELIMHGVRDWTRHVALPPRMGGSADYILDVIVLGPPIIESDEERDCSESPIATQSPGVIEEGGGGGGGGGGGIRKKAGKVSPAPSSSPPPKNSSPSSSSSSSGSSSSSSSGSDSDSPASPNSSPPPTDHHHSGHTGTHRSSHARLAPPFPRPYDIRMLHVRAADPREPLGMFSWEEVQQLLKENPAAADPVCRTHQTPLANVMDSVPAVWRRFVEEQCRPKSPLLPALLLLRDLAPGLTAALSALLLLLALHADISRALWIGAAFTGLLSVLSFLRGVAQPRDKTSTVRLHSARMRHAPEGFFLNKFSSFFQREEGSASGIIHVAEPLLKRHRVYLSTPNALFMQFRSLDLTPLIRVELSPDTHMPFGLSDQHAPDVSHLKGSRKFIVQYLCGPRLVLRMAKYAAGASKWRCIGELTGRQILALLLPHERYNFVLASSPSPRLVISHVGPGSAGGLYAKHALLANLGRVAFAGELWLDEKHTVHVNNSSGTYQPEDALLPRVEAFLTHAMQIQAHAHTRPDKDKMNSAAGTTTEVTEKEGEPDGEKIEEESKAGQTDKQQADPEQK